MAEGYSLEEVNKRLGKERTLPEGQWLGAPDSLLVDKGRMLEPARDESSLGRYTAHRDAVRLDDQWEVRHAGWEGNNRALGRAGNCTGLEGWRMEQVAVLVVGRLSLGTGYRPEPMNNLVHKLVMRGRSGHKPGCSVAEARGHRPATPRLIPHFRTTLVDAVYAPSELDDGVRARWSADGALTAGALAPVQALQRLVDDDLKYEVVKQNLRVLSRPEIPPPSSPRSRQADRNNRDYRQRMTAKRRGRLERLTIPRRR